jgi:CheY-specific phosphatase CheX
MHNFWKTELLQAAVLTFEELCFLFPDSHIGEEQLQASLEAVVRVSFQGPVTGCLVLRLYGDLLASLASNMLGEESCVSSAKQYDACGEIANVICGNVLPRIVNPQELFQLGVPKLMTPAAPAARDGELLVAEVHLGLDNGRVELQLFTDAAYEVTVGGSGV